MTPSLQLFIMLWANALLFAIILLTLLFGYPAAKRPWPSSPAYAFWIVGGVIILTNFVAGYPESFSIPRFAAKLRNLEYQPGARLAAWKARSVEEKPFTFDRSGLKSLWSFRGVTWGSALLAFADMWILVHDTGGGIESPYAPLLLGPAVLGPIVVMNARALIPLGVVAALWLFVTDATSPKTATVIRPGWLVYAIVSFFVVGWVLFIATIQLTEPTLRTPRQDVSLAPGGDAAEGVELAGGDVGAQ